MSEPSQNTSKRRRMPRTKPLSPVERDLAAIKEQIQQNTGIVLSNVNGRAKGISIDDLIAYREQGLSYDDIGKLVGCTNANVYQRLREYEFDIDFLPTFRRSEQNMIDILKGRILRSFSEAEIKAASFRDRSIALGILYDKSKQHFQNNTTNVFNVVIQQAHTQGKPLQVIENTGLSDNKHNVKLSEVASVCEAVSDSLVCQGGEGEAGQNSGV